MLWGILTAISLAGSDGLFVGLQQEKVAKSFHPRSSAWSPVRTRAHGRPARPSSDSNCSIGLPVLVSLAALACSQRRARKVWHRRTLLGYVAAIVTPKPVIAAEMCEGSVFNGSWTIPESLGGKANITVRDGTAVITGTKGGQKWELRSTNIQGAPLVFRIAGVQRQFWVDWSPLGGPAELRGVWQGGMLDGPLATGPPEIKWDNGSRWRKVSCNPE